MPSPGEEPELSILVEFISKLWPLAVPVSPFTCLHSFRTCAPEEIFPKLEEITRVVAFAEDLSLCEPA